MTSFDRPHQPAKQRMAAAPGRIGVLLVDDQALIAEALRRMLVGEPDIQFRYVGNGQAAVQSAIDFQPTVILQDLVMPVVDGFELVKQFRAHSDLQHVPIIVLSTKEDPELKAHGFAVGASDYLIKWPDKLELLARIRHHSSGYISRLERDSAFRALCESERKLAQANDELQRMARMKDEFISTVSHELRTPLTSIRGSLGLLAGGAVGEFPPQAQKLLDIANKNCERLVRMVNDVLDIEKMKSGQMRFDMVVQPLLPVVKQAIDATKGYAAQFGVKFKLLAPDTDIWVSADFDRMTQVLVNLLSNAIKYSHAGAEVEIRISRQSEQARLSVVDHGSGIPEEFRERIFQKFAQADSTDSRLKGGTGLGLSICKILVEEHRGHIDYRSEVGVGTEFYVDLPLAAR